MPYKGTPWSPYRPSNGSEGMDFEGAFCVRCKRDALYWKTQRGEDGCEIHAHAIAHRIDEAGYPCEWTHDEQGVPTCTAFEDDEL